MTYSDIGPKPPKSPTKAPCSTNLNHQKVELPLFPHASTTFDTIEKEINTKLTHIRSLIIATYGESSKLYNGWDLYTHKFNGNKHLVDTFFWSHFCKETPIGCEPMYGILQQEKLSSQSIITIKSELEKIQLKNDTPEFKNGFRQILSVLSAIHEYNLYITEHKEILQPHIKDDYVS